MFAFIFLFQIFFLYLQHESISSRKNSTKKFTPTQSVLHCPENYFLRFEDDDEMIVVKRSSIRSIIEDKAIVGKGKKHRIAVIEAKGTIDSVIIYTS